MVSFWVSLSKHSFDGGGVGGTCGGLRWCWFLGTCGCWGTTTGGSWVWVGGIVRVSVNVAHHNGNQLTDCHGEEDKGDNEGGHVEAMSAPENAYHSHCIEHVTVQLPDCPVGKSSKQEDLEDDKGIREAVPNIFFSAYGSILGTKSCQRIATVGSSNKQRYMLRSHWGVGSVLKKKTQLLFLQVQI